MCNSLGHGEYHVILTSIGCFVLGGVRIYLNCELEGTTFLAKSIYQWPMPPACPSAKFLTLWWQHRPLALFPLSLSPDQEMQIWFLCPWDIWPLNLGWRIQPCPYLTLFFLVRDPKFLMSISLRILFFAKACLASGAQDRGLRGWTPLVIWQKGLLCASVSSKMGRFIFTHLVWFFWRWNEWIFVKPRACSWPRCSVCAC